jgi:chromosome partitioning protein
LDNSFDFLTPSNSKSPLLSTLALKALLGDESICTLIDCPPNFNIVTKKALVASQGYFIPAKPDYLSTLGIEQLNRHVSQLCHDYNYYQKNFGNDRFSPIDPKTLGVIFTMVKYYGGEPIQDQREHIAAMQRLGLPIFETKIRENNRYFSRRTDDRQPRVMHNQSDGTFVQIREELESLAQEVTRASYMI